MFEILYPWIKAFHIMAVIAWMAGLFYLPRLFVYHAEKGMSDPSLHETFMVMEHKLIKVIMTPAMVVTWILGLIMASVPGVIDWFSIWPWAKLIAVLAMSGFHGWCETQRKRFAVQSVTQSGRYFRLMNEVPTVLMFVIVVAVIVRPF